MIESVSISAKVLKKLKTYKASDKEPFCGLLYGLRTDGEALVCSHYCFEESSPKAFLTQYDDSAKYMVEGVQPLGFFVQSAQASMQSSMLNMCFRFFPHNSPQKACFHGNNILIMSLQSDKRLDNSVDKPCFFYNFDTKGQDLAPIDVKEATEEEVRKIRNSFTLFHLQAKIPITINHSNGFEDKRVSIQHTINQLANQLASPLSIFKLPIKQQQKQQQNKFYLVRNTYKHRVNYDDFDATNDGDEDEDDGDKQRNGKREEEKGDCDDSSGADDSCGKGVKMSDVVDLVATEELDIGGYKQRVVQVELLLQRSGMEVNDFSLNSAPVLYHDHLNMMIVSLTLPLDVASLVANDDNTTPLATHLTRAINKQLKFVAETLNSFSRSSVYYIPKAYHYTLLDSLITLLYPEGVEERQLKETRKSLHERFLIPLSSPFFKRSKQTALSTHPPNNHLINVHLGLPPSKVNGKVTLLQGDYEYRHYMQDKFNDNGWGCAYRSLQTIASWLYLQGFTEKSVPTHLQIQQALVEVADKLPSFLGSKKWIGSTEVAYVLDQLFSVQCRICHVSCGSEMLSKVREIVHHFETQGGPIMIGGGVLAHTIIGVDFDEGSGAVSYLVLDPHYTGPDHLPTIQSKGWCGWKSGNFWQKGSFYNMCMPQKPSLY